MSAIKVHVFMGGKEIPEDLLNKIIIKNKSIDRIVNSITAESVMKHKTETVS